MGVVGIVPLGMLASALHSDGSAMGMLALGLVLTFGARLAAFMVAKMMDRDEAGWVVTGVVAGVIAVGTFSGVGALSALDEPTPSRVISNPFAQFGPTQPVVRPDKNLTGGSVRTGDRDAACGHARENRGPLSSARRDEILRRYGYPLGTHPDYEIDHLIPLCLGGADDPSNLWPQPRRSIEKAWNAEAKDRLERLMCNMVCDGQIDIATAQQAFATDWIAAYQKYVGQQPSGEWSREDIGDQNQTYSDEGVGPQPNQGPTIRAGGATPPTRPPEAPPLAVKTWIEKYPDWPYGVSAGN